MDHVAIMKKEWKLIPKILDGTKKIESRWGINKSSPWGRVGVGDTVYFKNSGEAVVAKAVVYRVLEFGDLNSEGKKQILSQYGKAIVVSGIARTLEWARNKRYCILIFLSHSRPVKPFNINKDGFGIGCAWLTTPDISRIVKP